MILTTKQIQSIAIFLNGSYSSPTFKPLLQNDKAHISPRTTSQTLVDDEFSAYHVADGGLNEILAQKINIATAKTTWYGDGDSLNTQSQEYLKRNASMTQQHLPTNKNLSDFAQILETISSHAHLLPLVIEVFGGLGGRRDHEMASIEEAKHFLALAPHGGIFCFHNELILSTLPLVVQGQKNRIFSVFLNKNTSIDIAGAQYSGKSVSLARPSHGLSNVVTENTLSLNPHGETLTLILTHTY